MILASAVIRTGRYCYVVWYQDRRDALNGRVDFGRVAVVVLAGP